VIRVTLLRKGQPSAGLLGLIEESHRPALRADEAHDVLPKLHGTDRGAWIIARTPVGFRSAPKDNIGRRDLVYDSLGLNPLDRACHLRHQTDETDCEQDCDRGSCPALGVISGPIVWTRRFIHIRARRHSGPPKFLTAEDPAWEGAAPSVIGITENEYVRHRV
jgi:hypothetical protein